MIFVLRFVIRFYVLCLAECVTWLGGLWVGLGWIVRLYTVLEDIDRIASDGRVFANNIAASRMHDSTVKLDAGVL